MTGPVPPGPPEDDPPRVVLIVQVISLLSFSGYALAGLFTHTPLDRYVLLGLLVFGLGLRPETLGALLRGFTGGKR